MSHGCAKDMPEFIPRYLRPNEAAYYCGMGRTIFEREIRPNLRPIRVGEQGIAFDRVDLDAVLDEHKNRNLLPQETRICIKQKSPASIGTGKAETAASINGSRAMDAFESALRRSRGLKQRQGTTRS